MERRNGNLRLWLLLISMLTYVGFGYGCVTSHFAGHGHVRIELAEWLVNTARYLVANARMAVINVSCFSIFPFIVAMVFAIAALRTCPKKIHARHLLLLLYPLVLLTVTSMWDAFCLPPRNPDEYHAYDKYQWQVDVFNSLIGLLLAPYAAMYLYILRSTALVGERKFATLVILSYTVISVPLILWHEFLIADVWP